jgi:hypothetical protein
VVDKAMKQTRKQLKKVTDKNDRSTYSSNVTTAAENK